MIAKGSQTLREAIAEFEVVGRGLDPGRESLAELWAAVGSHVLESATALGRAPAYVAAALDASTGFSFDEGPAGIGEALSTIKAVENDGVNQTWVAISRLSRVAACSPAALGDLLAGVGNRYAGIRFAAPAAAEMERMLVQWMAELAPSAGSSFLTSFHRVDIRDHPKSVVALDDSRSRPSRRHCVQRRPAAPRRTVPRLP